MELMTKGKSQLFLCGNFFPNAAGISGKVPEVSSIPNDWHITHSPNHWCNEDTIKDYITHILIPYVKKKREDLNLSPDHHALVIYDKFKAQCTQI